MSLLTMIDHGVNACFACMPRKKPSATALSQVRLIAHRGAHNKKMHCIENTHAAFALAKELGCWGIELDVHATADGVLVVNHDDTLKRLWGIDQSIGSLSAKTLRQLAPFVPTLDEVVLRYGKMMHLFIEIKAPFDALSALRLSLQSLTPAVDYHLLSLDEPLLASLSEFPLPSRLLVANYNNTQRFCDMSLQKHYGGVLGHYLLFTKTQIKKLRHANQQLGVGFVNSKGSLYREVGRQLTWLFSDNVNVVSSYLNQ